MNRDENLRWALAAIDLVYSGLRSAGHKEGGVHEKDGAFLVSGSTELINLNVARASIKASLEGDQG